jgi:hypothetical protein
MRIWFQGWSAVSLRGVRRDDSGLSVLAVAFGTSGSWSQWSALVLFGVAPIVTTFRLVSTVLALPPLLRILGEVGFGLVGLRRRAMQAAQGDWPALAREIRELGQGAAPAPWMQAELALLLDESCDVRQRDRMFLYSIR